MNITCAPFGKTRDGRPVERYTLTDGACAVSVLTLGGIIQSFVLPDRTGRPIDIVLGFDTVQAYEAQDCYIGALLGRCANRIADGQCVLNGRRLSLPCNDNGLCHLHGGTIGFDRRLWTAGLTSDGLTLGYTSPDGEQGYPGTLAVSVTYRLEGDTLSLTYTAESSKDTLCNLSNHAYFNLAGQGSGPVGAQQVCVHADSYAPLGDSGTCTGEIAPVTGTPLDLRAPRPLADGWDDPFDQIARAHGYDHHYFVNGTGLRPFAEAFCPESGLVLTVCSDLPGMQLYSGNFLSSRLPAGKDGAAYDRRCGFCMETQYAPNAMNCPQFARPILRAGEQYRSRTEYRCRLA